MTGKGAPRRKVAKVGANPAGDDKKVAAALKKLAVAPIAGIEEVNMFQVRIRQHRLLNARVIC